MTLWAGRLTPAASVLVVHSMLIAPYKARWRERERERRWVRLRGRGRGKEEEKKRKLINVILVEVKWGSMIPGAARQVRKDKIARMQKQNKEDVN